MSPLLTAPVCWTAGQPLGMLYFTDTAQSCLDSLCASSLTSELGPAYASCFFINGCRGTYTQGHPSGCGPLTFLPIQPLPWESLTNLVSTPPGALPGKDLPARAQKDLSPASQHQVLQWTFSRL